MKKINNKNTYISKRISGWEMDYNKFTYSTLNRPVNLNQVMRLHDSMQRHDNISAISCIKDKDGKLKIIDGQHRFEACKELKIPIEYDIWDIEEDSMIVLNESQKNWKLEDYLNYGVKNKKEDYILLDEYRKKTGIGLGALIELFSDEKSINQYKSRNEIFKSMLWKMGNNKTSLEILNLILELYEKFGVKHYFHLRFILAFRDIYNSSQYSHKRMIEQINKGSLQLTPQINKVDHIRCFEKVYNFGRKDEILFLKDRQK